MALTSVLEKEVDICPLKPHTQAIFFISTFKGKWFANA